MAGWSKLPGDLEFDQGPAVSSWGPNHLDVFVPDQGGQLYHSAWDGQTWSPWEKVGDGTVAFKVAAISRHVNSVDVLAVRTDKKQMYRLTGENGSFGNWQLISPLGTQMTFSAGPGVSSWGEGELDAFARGGGRNLLQHASFDGVQWNEWQAWIDEPILMAPAAIGWIGNTAGDLAKHIEIFVLKASGQARKGPVLHLAYTDPTLPPSSVPLDLESDKAPAVASWAPSTRLDVFARGTSGTVLWTKLEGTQTTDWEPISQSVVNSAPAAVSWGEGRIDVFVLGSDNRVWHRAYDGTNWFEPPF